MWMSFRPLLLTDGIVLLDQTGGPHHAVALPQVPPPHMLVCDLDDVADREPALLAVWQPDSFIQTCRVVGGGRREEEDGGCWEETREEWRFLSGSCKRKHLNEVLKVEEEAHPVKRGAGRLRSVIDGVLIWFDAHQFNGVQHCGCLHFKLAVCSHVTSYLHWFCGWRWQSQWAPDWARQPAGPHTAQYTAPADSLFTHTCWVLASANRCTHSHTHIHMKPL